MPTGMATTGTVEQVRVNPKPSTIHDQLAESRAQLDRLVQCVDRLREKLGPVLRSPLELASAARLDQSPPSERSSVAISVADIGARLEEVTAGLNEMYDRVDLDVPEVF